MNKPMMRVSISRSRPVRPRPRASRRRDIVAETSLTGRDASPLCPTVHPRTRCETGEAKPDLNRPLYCKPSSWSRTLQILTLLRVPRGHLRQVSEVVSLHFEVEYLALGLRCIGNEKFVEQVLKQSRRSEGLVDENMTPEPAAPRVDYRTFMTRLIIYQL